MGKVACIALAAFAMAAAAGVFKPCAAQNSPQDFVNLHNAARAAVGVGPVSWDGVVAAFAWNWARRPEPIGGSGYGSNTFIGSGRNYTAADAVGAWVSERQWYDYGGNSCSGETCLHYTQVVWRASTAIGCARAVCSGGRILFLCNYKPLGNIIGPTN